MRNERLHALLLDELLRLGVVERLGLGRIDKR